MINIDKILNNLGQENPESDILENEELIIYNLLFNTFLKFTIKSIMDVLKIDENDTKIFLVHYEQLIIKVYKINIFTKYLNPHEFSNTSIMARDMMDFPEKTISRLAECYKDELTELLENLYE